MDSSIVPEEFLAHIGTDDVETRATNKSLPPDGRITSVAVISAKNALLFIRAYDYNEMEKVKVESQAASHHTHEVMYNALDVVEERMMKSDEESKQNVLEADGFIGCLAVYGDTALYGTVTPSGYRIFVAIRGARYTVDGVGGPVRSALRRISNAVIYGVLNPLRELDAPLRGSTFHNAVLEAVRGYS